MIIYRYLMKEVLFAMFSASFVMLLVFLSNQAIRYLKYAANGKIASSVVLNLIGLEIPYLLVLLLPLGLFLGIIIAYSRMYAENEMRVLHASGFSSQRLVLITLFSSFVVSLIVGFLSLYINPLLANEKDKLLKKSLATENIMDVLIPGRFQFGKDDTKVIYVESIDKDKKGARNVFVAEQKKDPNNLEAASSWSVLSARTGYQMRDAETNGRFVVATEGNRYEGKPGEQQYKMIQFEKYALRLPEQAIGTRHQVEEIKSTKLLWQNYHDINNVAELQFRMAMPISALLLGMLAIPLSYVRPRQGRYTNIFPGILIYVIYINLIFLTRDWMEKNTLSTYLGMWMIHSGMLFICGLAYLFNSGIKNIFYKRFKLLRLKAA